MGAAGLVGLSLLTWSSFTKFRDGAYPIPAPYCQGSEDCEQRSLQLEARQAATADAALDISLFQLALGCLGVGGVGVTILYAHQAWKEARRSADAAMRGVEAALRALKVTEDYGQIQMRAYLDLTETRVQDFGPGKAPSARGYLKNSGSTPAKRVRLTYSMQVGRFPLLGPPPRRAPDTPPMSGAQVSAGEIVNLYVTLPQPLSASVVEEIGAGAAAIYFWGTVKYEDVFGKPHESSFCTIYGGAAGCEPDGMMGAYRDGNHSD